MLFLTLSLALSSYAQAEVRDTCVPFASTELPLERDYQILQSKEDIYKNLVRFYNNDRRPLGRAYWDQTASSFMIPYSGNLIKVPTSFFAGLSQHFASALKNQYANAVIYPDMGHAHLQLPLQEWAALKAATEDSGTRMTQVLNSKNLKALYHTAEMLQIKEGDFAKGKMPQDPWKLWRYFSRNILGSFGGLNSIEILWAGPQATYNTVRAIPDMTEVTTIYFSSNKSGCFPYASPEGEKYFDLTFATIPYEKSN